MVDGTIEPITIHPAHIEQVVALRHTWNEQSHTGAMSGSVSSDYRQILAGLEIILAQAARRIESAPGDWLPGIADVVESIVLYTASSRRHMHGWYCPNAWRDARSGQRFAEIVLNADNLNEPAEEVLDTLLHELVHAYAEAAGLQDTSRRGAYHNRRFADLALKVGLIVERHPTRGFTTAGISPLGHALYGDLIEPLRALLRFHRDGGPDDPEPGGAAATRDPQSSPGVEQPESKYVMAQCGCTNDSGRPIVIRVARGSWTAGTIWCRRCTLDFSDPNVELSESPQLHCPARCDEAA